MLNIHERQPLRRNAFLGDRYDKDRKRRGRDHESSKGWSPKQEGWNTRRPRVDSEFDIVEQLTEGDTPQPTTVDKRIGSIALSDQERRDLAESGILIISA